MTEQEPGRSRGWYPDPWSVGQHRFWSGAEWTSDVFPSGPGVFVHPPAPSEPLPTRASDTPLPPPDWLPDGPAPSDPQPATTPTWLLPPPAAGAPLPADAPRERAARPSIPALARNPFAQAGVAALVAILIAYFVTSAFIGGSSNDASPPPPVATPSTAAPSSSAPSSTPSTSPSAAQPSTTAPTPVAPSTAPSTSPSSSSGVFGDAPPSTAPSSSASTSPSAGASAGAGSGGSSSTDPEADQLQKIVVRQPDVDTNSRVGVQTDGTSTTVPTLDLCNGTYATEALRTARLQVDDVDTSTLSKVLSTEGVLYKDAASAQKALAEVKSVAAACPNKAVTSPVGEATLTTTLTAVGQSWAQTSGVSAVAWNVHATDDQGNTTDSTAVYLVRGRVLLGVYFATQSASQPTIAGANTMEGIVKVFAGRLAALPSSVTGG